MTTIEYIKARLKKATKQTGLSIKYYRECITDCTICRFYNNNKCSDFITCLKAKEIARNSEVNSSFINFFEHHLINIAKDANCYEPRHYQSN